MQTRKRFEKSKITVSGDVPAMLKKAKTVLSDKQYRELCVAVNEAADYNNVDLSMIIDTHPQKNIKLSILTQIFIL